MSSRSYSALKQQRASGMATKLYIAPLPRQGARLRHIQSSRDSGMPALFPFAAAYGIAKVWLLKPAGALLKTTSASNVLRIARTGNMIR